MTTQAWDVQGAEQDQLENFAYTVASQIQDGTFALGSPDRLHEAALEMNRRHGHAFTQTADDVLAAIQTLEEIDQFVYQINWDVADVNWERVRVERARALGLLLDKGTDASWGAVSYTPEGVRGSLHSQAIIEGRARGFEHALVQPVRAPFLPEDAVAPF
jgi:hypothetical protein